MENINSIIYINLIIIDYLVFNKIPINNHRQIDCNTAR